LVCTDNVFAFRLARPRSSKPQSEARKDAASRTTQPKEPADDREFAKKVADCKSYEEQLEVCWADYEENPNYWESDEDYVCPS